MNQNPTDPNQAPVDPSQPLQSPAAAVPPVDPNIPAQPEVPVQPVQTVAPAPIQPVAQPAQPIQTAQYVDPNTQQVMGIPGQAPMKRRLSKKMIIIIVSIVVAIGLAFALFFIINSLRTPVVGNNCHQDVPMYETDNPSNSIVVPDPDISECAEYDKQIVSADSPKKVAKYYKRALKKAGWKFNDMSIISAKEGYSLDPDTAELFGDGAAYYVTKDDSRLLVVMVVGASAMMGAPTGSGVHIAHYTSPGVGEDMKIKKNEFLMEYSDSLDLMDVMDGMEDYLSDTGYYF